jgi:hypothetical protein
MLGRSLSCHCFRALIRDQNGCAVASAGVFAGVKGFTPAARQERAFREAYRMAQADRQRASPFLMRSCQQKLYVRRSDFATDAL